MMASLQGAGRRMACLSLHLTAAVGLPLHIAPTQYPTNQLPSRKKKNGQPFFLLPVQREFQNATFFSFFF